MNLPFGICAVYFDLKVCDIMYRWKKMILVCEIGDSKALFFFILYHRKRKRIIYIYTYIWFIYADINYVDYVKSWGSSIFWQGLYLQFDASVNSEVLQFRFVSSWISTCTMDSCVDRTYLLKECLEPSKTLFALWLNCMVVVNICIPIPNMYEITLAEL